MGCPCGECRRKNAGAIIMNADLYSSSDRVACYWLLRQWRSRNQQELIAHPKLMDNWRLLRSHDRLAKAIDGLHSIIRLGRDS